MLYVMFPYIQWMKDDFLPYLDEVGKIDIGSEDEFCDIVEDCTTKEKQKRQAERRKQLAKKKLSKETYHGIRMTGMRYSYIYFQLITEYHKHFCSLFIH